MVVINLKGGTGNQFYQYAFGLALAELGNEVYFNRGPLDNDSTRAYTLDRWNTDVKFKPAIGRLIQEPDLLYHPELLKKYGEDVNLDGYWQSYKYWSPEVQKKIRFAFFPKYIPSRKTFQVADDISQHNSVFLHVRRTDNLSERGLAFHGLGSKDYWDKATRNILLLSKDLPRFFIFSDDIEWCKQQSYFRGATFVDHNTTGVTVDSEYALTKTDTGTEHEDLWLMSRCKNAVIATSTFSWWGAWLGAHSNDGIVVRPQRWFVGEKNSESRDMFPPEWIAV